MKTKKTPKPTQAKRIERLEKEVEDLKRSLEEVKAKPTEQHNHYHIGQWYYPYPAPYQPWQVPYHEPFVTWDETTTSFKTVPTSELFGHQS